VLGPEELGKRADYSPPHTVHCGPGYRSCRAWRRATATTAGRVALLDHAQLRGAGPFESGGRDRQYLAYDVWWHINHDVLVTRVGNPSMIENGIRAGAAAGRKYGHRLHFWDMNTRSTCRRVDLGDEHQMALELRPAHDPAKKYGFVGVVVSVEDLSASIWLWHEQDGQWAATKVISIPAEPARSEDLPPALQPFGAVPPLFSDLALSVDDRHLYVSCWGTGEMKQYDVSDPFHPRETGSVRIGGIVGRVPHPASPGQPLAGGRRWWRSAGTASACTSPTPCTVPGTSSSTPTASARG
jgi:selenium-binding protein 1